MKIKTEKIIPEHKETVVKRLKCDMCGNESHNGSQWSGSWGVINKTTVEVVVKLVDGMSYPEGGYATVYSVDLCPQCFKTRLVPWLKEQGCVVEERDVEW